jgi:hypothetical protein
MPIASISTSDLRGVNHSQLISRGMLGDAMIRFVHSLRASTNSYRRRIVPTALPVPEPRRACSVAAHVGVSSLDSGPRFAAFFLQTAPHPKWLHGAPCIILRITSRTSETKGGNLRQVRSLVARHRHSRAALSLIDRCRLAATTGLPTAAPETERHPRLVTLRGHCRHPGTAAINAKAATRWANRRSYTLCADVSAAAITQQGFKVTV